MSECLSCQWAGGCALSTSTAADHYELHITVESADVTAFREACGWIGVKPILLDLHLRQGGVMKDMMTSSTVRGTLAEAKDELALRSEQLEAAGFTVVRRKIETTPWNPLIGEGAPGYFESHVPVVTAPEHVDALREIAHAHGMHLSRNAFKAADGVVTLMLTLRDHATTREAFEAAVEAAKSRLLGEGFTVERTIVEFAIHDTRVEHDAAWITPTAIAA